jgi:hypothetical protein
MNASLLDEFDAAQRLSFQLLSASVAALEEGMTEADLDAVTRDLAKTMGFEGWFHPPEIQFGERSKSNAIWKIPSKTNRLAKGDLVVLDFGPASGEAYGDVGTTIAFEREEPEVLEVARECVRATCGFASQWKTVGELFVFAKAWAVNNRLTLASTRSIGHAILPKDGLLAFNFPRSAHTATWLRRHQIRFLNPARLEGIWALRPLLTDGTHGAAFEEMIYVSGEGHRILGRDDLAHVGTLPVLD